jgi:hypothetical protein
VFIGFAPTFYLKAFTAAPSLSPLVWAHGLLFTSWTVLLITQATLVAKERLGMFGVALALAMVVVGLLTAISAARLGHVPPGAPPPLVFMAIPFFAIVEFAILFGAAIALRGNSQAHKRLILLKTGSRTVTMALSLRMSASIFRFSVRPASMNCFFECAAKNQNQDNQRRAQQSDPPLSRSASCI